MIHETISIQTEGSLPDTRLTTYILDAYEEQDPGLKRPLVLVCPGGAYRFTADREAEMIALQFNSMGYHSAVLRYSCAPAVFPTALTEVAASIKMIKEQSENWHVDTEKIFVMGFSAGGHLAASYGVFWNRSFVAEAVGCSTEFLKIAGMILCYPVLTSKEEYTHLESIHNLLGEDYEAKKEEMALENQVGPHTPPAFLWHTFADDAVPFQNSLFFVEAMGKADVSAEYHLYPEGPHGLSLADESLVRPDGSGIQKECQSWMPLLKTWLRRTCERISEKN
ncbi:MAG: alpha/beta hydrolase [Firmicutes bacterium]|nr:alpha/beta hydrolase [Bacillota bacterium]MDY3716600.1 alpha/beta hydrolase [Blautia sp.]